MLSPRKWRRIRSNKRGFLFLEQTNKQTLERKGERVKNITQPHLFGSHLSLFLCKINENLSLFCNFKLDNFTFLLTSCYLVPLGLQIDLEPVGKVHVIIDLVGSSSEGKKIVQFDLWHSKCDDITWTKRYYLIIAGFQSDMIILSRLFGHIYEDYLSEDN